MLARTQCVSGQSQPCPLTRIPGIDQKKIQLLSAIGFLLPYVTWIFVMMAGTGVATNDYVLKHFSVKNGLNVSFANLSVCNIDKESSDYKLWRTVQSEATKHELS